MKPIFAICLFTIALGLLDAQTIKAHEAPTIIMPDGLEQRLDNAFDELIKKNGSAFTMLSQKQGELLVTKILKGMRSNMVPSTDVILSILVHPKGREENRLKERIRAIVISWTRDEGSKLEILTGEQINELANMIVHLSKTVSPATLEHTRYVIDEWAENTNSTLGSLTEGQKRQVAETTGLLDQAVLAVINSQASLPEAEGDFLATDFMNALEENPNLRDLMEHQIEELSMKFLDNMNEIRLKPSTRIGVLSMLINPTTEENDEFKIQLEAAFGWHNKPHTPLNNLTNEEMQEVRNVLVDLRNKYAQNRRRLIGMLVDKLDLMYEQKSELTAQLVDYMDDLRREVIGW